MVWLQQRSAIVQTHWFWNLRIWLCGARASLRDARGTKIGRVPCGGHWAAHVSIFGRWLGSRTHFFTSSMKGGTDLFRYWWGRHGRALAVLLLWSVDRIIWASAAPHVTASCWPRSPRRQSVQRTMHERANPWEPCNPKITVQKHWFYVRS
jgi:hypothetical protein